MNRNEQAVIGAVIYGAISVTFSVLSGLFAWAIFGAPLYQVAVPFLGAMLFIVLAGLSGWASMHLREADLARRALPG